MEYIFRNGIADLKDMDNLIFLILPTNILLQNSIGQHIRILKPLI